MQILEDLRKVFNDFLESKKFTQSPSQLYEPNNYFLSIGGKRMRPVLVLLGNHLYNKKYPDVLPAALAIEYFHNFSLIHDDMMDQAPLRRGHTTVHEKYGPNTAILSGDALLVYAYKSIADIPERFLKDVLDIFTNTAVEVCEGQQYDMNFETQSAVSESEYIEMIRLKTSVVLAAGLKIGALIGGADQQDTDSLYHYAINLGIAFQIQDDILDCYGDVGLVGKQPGGDIIQNKKTILLIRALAKAKSEKDSSLEQILCKSYPDKKEKVIQVLALYEKYQIRESVENLKEDYIQKALSYLENTSLHADKKEILLQLVEYLVRRKY